MRSVGGDEPYSAATKCRGGHYCQLPFQRRTTPCGVARVSHEYCQYAPLGECCGHMEYYSRLSTVTDCYRFKTNVFGILIKKDKTLRDSAFGVLSSCSALDIRPAAALRANSRARPWSPGPRRFGFRPSSTALGGGLIVHPTVGNSGI